MAAILDAANDVPVGPGKGTRVGWRVGVMVGVLVGVPLGVCDGDTVGTGEG